MNMNPSSPKDATKLRLPLSGGPYLLVIYLYRSFIVFALIWHWCCNSLVGSSYILGMVGKGSASIEDLLLLFIYLEIGAMSSNLLQNQPHARALPY
jgi:phosphate starvation-inducible membrane PsiE